TKQTAAKFLAQKHDFDYWLFLATNAALRCERRLAILERSETAKRCESLLNALLCLLYYNWNIYIGNVSLQTFVQLQS
ncbi:hypothetical protein ACPV4U_24810, partial [Vibrio alginolyticus]|uniref:hypothetical protein n=1 Tax=Vibrio alginolyticus TaxID=663 RepID=UPI004068334C